MTSALGCTVLVDGLRLADGTAGDDPDDPTALDGLKVTWGRGTTLDQPAPATCSLVVADSQGGLGPFQLLAVGRRLDVLATAQVYPDPTVSTITDPGFDTTGPGSTVTNGTVTVGGGRALAWPKDPAKRLRVIFPPAPYGGADPAAWDLIPRTAPGQLWRYGATVTLPPTIAGAAVAAAAVHPVAFTRPLASTATVLADTLPVPAGTVGAHAVAATFTPPPGVWLGVAVDLFPTGPTWAQLDQTTTWAQLAAVTWRDLTTVAVDDLLVLAPAAGTARSALVFSGRITDLEASYEDARAMTLVAVTAQDHTAELANRDVADTPWAAEGLGVRAQRIVTLSGQATTLTVDPGIAATVVTRRDVDAQPALRQLQDLAVSADAVLWSAVHETTGQYLRMEDTAARPPLLELAEGADGVVRIVTRPAIPGAVPMDACDPLLDPLRFVADVADVATRVAVRWLDQTTSPDTTERTETLTDAALVDQLGVRRIGVGTDLTTSAAAAALAARILARVSTVGYRLTGLTWDTGVELLDPDAIGRAMTLLDGTTRNGVPIQLTGIPDWAPVPGGVVGLYLEGGTYSYTAAAWLLDMTVSRATGQGGAGSVTWAQLDPTWQWRDFDPAIRWMDLQGVAP